eukprot:gnl/MRDRNA2_/MRDRNA2_145058_c0_seq1.p1 gnl/MRDRNA2_/MRDRNA2_145058_c0~~gnl/MRDRNA2_/MRDRNA2_145058_c0_seq1.p1  ORF type:complete len:473 (+),score=80.03 gnl/MRDRNA2_/MRDRNA2_145058_c0_seq1:116-1534(+)
MLQQVLQETGGERMRAPQSTQGYALKDSSIVPPAPSTKRGRLDNLGSLCADLESLLGPDWTIQLRSALIGPTNSRAARSRTVELKMLSYAFAEVGVACSGSVLNSVLRVAGPSPVIEDVLKVLSCAPNHTHKQTLQAVFQKLSSGAPMVSLETLRKAFVAPTVSLDVKNSEMPTIESLRVVFLKLRGLQHVAEDEFLLAHHGVFRNFTGTDDDFARLVGKTWGINDILQMAGEATFDSATSSNYRESQAASSKHKKDISQLPANLYLSIGGLREAVRRYGPSALQFLKKELQYVPGNVDDFIVVLKKIVPEDFELQEKLRISDAELMRLAVAFAEPYGEVEGLLDILDSNLNAYRAMVLHDIFRSITSCFQRKSVQNIQRQCQIAMVSRCKFKEKIPQVSQLMQNIVRKLESSSPESTMKEGHFLRLHEDLSQSIRANDAFQQVVRTLWGLGLPSNEHLVSNYRMRNQSHSR